MRVLFISSSDKGIDWFKLGLGLRWPDLTSRLALPDSEIADMISEEEPHLVVVYEDQPTPQMWNVIQTIREQFKVPMMVATKSDSEIDIVKSFDLGADDYISMPCGLMEMTVRAVAVMRRARANQRNSLETSIQLGDLVIDPASRQVFLGDETLKLTVNEFKVLYILAQNANTAVSRELLGRQLWYRSINSSECLKKYIQRLRAKLGDDAKNPKWIRTIRGFGYQIGPLDQKVQQNSVSPSSLAR